MLLLLLLLNRQLRLRCVLTGLEAQTLAVNLSVLLLQGLELCKLQRVQLLATEHLRSHDHLTLGKLKELRLALILELANGADGLVHGCTGTVAGLEGAALLSKAGPLLVLTLVLVVGLAPVAVKVPGR